MYMYLNTAVLIMILTIRHFVSNLLKLINKNTNIVQAVPHLIIINRIVYFIILCGLKSTSLEIKC